MRRIAALLIGLCLTSCSGQESSPQNRQSQFVSANMYVTEEHDGSIVPLRPGQSFEVRLPENMAIDPPVQWVLSVVPPHLRLLGSSVASRSTRARDPATVRTFRFGAIAEGDGRLVFEARQAGRRVGFRVEAANDMVID